MTTLSTDEEKRYDRQLMISEIGTEGQKRLKQAHVFIAGLGGLGSIIAYYLSAAGIGNLTIADNDWVTLDNLNRQILYQTTDIGRLKTESASERLNALNPLCRITTVTGNIAEERVLDRIAGHALIVDATDNLAVRQALNRAALKYNIPFIFGGVQNFDGMVTTIIPGKTPCLACLFPKRRMRNETYGIIGPTAGLIASIQCHEAIKIVVGMKASLANRLLTISGIDLTFRSISLERDPECKVCCDSAVINRINMSS